ncbi:MFS transporter [Hazenella sp. IB182353]|uniref:MFS transporter n=1 Tax=Polycladospora coralii TaxID=2771432 RepID=UPI001746214F|nr:MFS transporter [Polycladospora coralii]MBS7531656.1 MFS transporter [Polycladospora coralii]
MIYVVALTYLVLETTGSPKYMALTMIFATIPYLLSPLAGALIDRLNMKPYIIVGDMIRGLCMFCICFLLFMDMLTIYFIYGTAFITGLIGVIYRPTFGSLLPQMVPHADIPRANALNALSGQVSQLMGFVFGGVLVAYWGTLNTIFINGITFFIMAILLGFIKFPCKDQNLNFNRSIWKDIGAGFQYLFSNRKLVIIPFVFFIMGASLAPLEILMPLKLQEFDYGAEAFGLFFMCLLIGEILVSAILSKYGDQVNLDKYATIGLVIMSIAMFVIPISTHIAVACASAFVYGIGAAVVGVHAVSNVQMIVKDHYRGRIFSLFGIIETACMPIALVVVSILIDLIYPMAILFITSGVLLLTSLLWFVIFRNKTNNSDYHLAQ